MTETAEPRSKAQDTVAMTAATMGHDIVAALLQELRTMPGQWGTLSADFQQQAIERFKEKVSDTVRKAISFMLTSDFAAVPAKVEYVSRKKGISAGVTVATNAMFRHAFFDAQGQHVLIVIADPEKWMARMDEIKARGNQLELFDPDANYDPQRDQPGYRRDRDPLAPGASWDELKQSFGLGTKEPTAETPAPEGETKAPDPETTGMPGGPPPDVVADDLTPEQRHQATLREFQERLTAAGVEISLGALQARSDADILAASLWLNWYSATDIGTPFIDRPAWIPEPPHNVKKGTSK